LFAFDGVDSDLFVVLLQSSQIFSGLREFSLFHTFTDIPVNKRSLGVHKIELVVKSSPGLSNGGGVAQHANGSLDLGQISAWNDGWWLVIDTDLETGWAPVNKLNGSLGLDGGDSGVDVLWDNVTSVQHAAGHVLTVSWITLDHLVGWLEASVGDFGDGELFVVGFLGGDDWSVGDQWEMDPWVWDQVGLELCQINVQSTVEPQGGGDGGNDLTDQPVQVGVGWSFDVEVSSADIVDSFVIDHESAVGVLQSGMGGEDGVVWLDNSGGNLWGWVDGKFQLGFFAVVDGESFHQKGSESGSGSTTERVEDEESLETGTLVSKLSNSVENQVNDLFTDGVVTSGVVVSGILFTGDQLFWVEELSVSTGSDFIDDSWLQINEDSSWDVFAGTSFREKGVERVVAATNGFVAWHLSIRLDSVLEAVEFPAGVTDLDSGLSDVDRDTLSHF